MLELNKLQDSVWIVLKPSNSFTLLFGCIYRQTNTSVDELAILPKVFKLASSLPFSVNIICGDFKMPDVSWFPVQAPKRDKQFIECIELEQWSQYVSRPTRYQNTLNSFFASRLSHSTVYYGKTFKCSVHKIVIYSPNIRTTTSRRKAVTLRRNYLKVDWNNFNKCISSTYRRTLFTAKNAVIVTSIFYNNRNILSEFAYLEYQKNQFSIRL